MSLLGRLIDLCGVAHIVAKMWRQIACTGAAYVRSKETKKKQNK